MSDEILRPQVLRHLPQALADSIRDNTIHAVASNLPATFDRDRIENAVDAALSKTVYQDRLGSSNRVVAAVLGIVGSAFGFAAVWFIGEEGKSAVAGILPGYIAGFAPLICGVLSATLSGLSGLFAGRSKLKDERPKRPKTGD